MQYFTGLLVRLSGRWTRRTKAKAERKRRDERKAGVDDDEGRCKVVSGPTIHALRSTSWEGATRRFMRFLFAAFHPGLRLYIVGVPCAARQRRKCITPTVRASFYEAPRHRRPRIKSSFASSFAARGPPTLPIFVLFPVS